jgi:hypothetical protein
MGVTGCWRTAQSSVLLSLSSQCGERCFAASDSEIMRSLSSSSFLNAYSEHNLFRVIWPVLYCCLCGVVLCLLLEEARQLYRAEEREGEQEVENENEKE